MPDDKICCNFALYIYIYIKQMNGFEMLEGSICVILIVPTKFSLRIIETARWTAKSGRLSWIWSLIYRGQIGTLGTKLQWNTNRNLYTFIQENVVENVVRKLAAILSHIYWISLGYSLPGPMEVLPAIDKVNIAWHVPKSKGHLKTIDQR